MIEIIPFKAFVPKKDLAAQVSTRQLNSYSKQEISELKIKYPDSFVNIILHDEDKREMELSDRFRKINELFQQSILEDIFVESQKESIYLYRQSNAEKTYTGIIGGASTKDYQEGRIKKHEHTIEKREKLFTKYLELTGFNAEPILLIYKSNPYIKELIEELLLSKPIHNFLSDDGLKHELWEIQNSESINEIQLFFKTLEHVYIADGHHRSASSSLLALQEKDSYAAQFVMSLFMDEENINIYDFNRVIKNNQDLSKNHIIDKLSNYFEISDESEKVISPSRKHEFTLYLEGKWTKLSLKTKFIDKSSIIKRLDSQIITDLILSPIFGIQDLKKDKRVDFIPGNNGLESLKSEVDNGKYDLAIAMFPVSPEELKLVADNNLAMPPKSTYIEPKLRSGLTVYKF